MEEAPWVGLCIQSEKGEITKYCFFSRLLFQANSTFNALAKLKELADLWDELGPRVWDFLQDSPQVNAMRVRLCTERQYNKISFF